MPRFNTSFSKITYTFPENTKGVFAEIRAKIHLPRNIPMEILEGGYVRVSIDRNGRIVEIRAALNCYEALQLAGVNTGNYYRIAFPELKIV